MNSREEKRRAKRIKRIRHQVISSPSRPRLIVVKSNKHIYAQLVNHEGKTLTQASTLSKEVKTQKKVVSTMETAKAVGELIAAKAKKLGFEHMALDRNAYPYHGKLKALADAARASGIQF